MPVITVPLPVRSFDTAFEMVQEHVEVFQKHHQHHLSPTYTEAKARKDFIDKFWIALGWDVNHDKQKNPYEQDVKVEHSGKGSERRRRADYAFLKPNFRDVRFYVEAKKPGADIETRDHYFQTIRYGWNSNTPLAVLTDFEQFHILDCRHKPDIDTALSRGHKKFHYTQYGDREKFAEIYYLFSREEVIKGSIERYAAGLPVPKNKARLHTLFPTGGYQRVDESFLKQLDAYRDELARSFKNRNPDLGREELTELTQRTLDRLVFIRFLEDKLIEPEPIVENFGKKGSAWQDFIAASAQLDRIYNGIIFKHHEILDSRGFRVDEHVFDGICDDLSRADSPYDFNSIPIHILGSIYERFLGKTIITTGKRARVVDKPEVRKASGAYYTPEHIVRYIVENSVGNLIASKTPGQIAKMHFADIACGSGSFLLGVFDLLLRHNTAYYNRNKANHEKGARVGCLKCGDGTLQLSLKQKQGILVNNIFGVDIDQQAVEVAQLSLYLKLLEEETIATSRAYQLEFGQRLLPPLGQNIVNGNSLIRRDILEGRLFETGDELKLTPMNFEEAFPQIIKSGGFDAIVGNPPWGASFNAFEKDYLSRNYACFLGNHESYLFFIERAGDLLKAGGNMGFVTPDSWIKIPQAQKLRDLVLKRLSVASITTLPQRVFNKVSANCITFVLAKRSDIPRCVVNVLLPKSHLSQLTTGEFDESYSIAPLNWAKSPDKQFQIFQKEEIASIIEKMQFSSDQARLHLDVMQGIVPYSSETHSKQTIQQRKFHATTRITDKYGVWIQGRSISRYALKSEQGEYLNYGEWLHRPRQPKYFDGPRILIQEITGGHPPRIAACFCDINLYHDPGVISCLNTSNLHTFYILGILNSRLLSWYHRYSSPKGIRHAFPKVLIGDIRKFPIYPINFSYPKDKLRHDRMVQLVEQTIRAKKLQTEARTDKDKTFYENKCASLDLQIDGLVYELYGLTDEEIAVVEREEIAVVERAA